ncbi:MULTISPECIES: enoyl-CoA hydratase/isomerase family protein [Burkholderia cepacia complex]|uniref:enoyl-CoA hydratase/isomerase family protein n=1 Tax=Burkholderia cepacia complex TaxID=87882 RepID=UPI000F0985BC|nr:MULTISPECIES: enoyl-CoA hydratase/isomerase family protein [Burkholderia cepacia complex]AYQ43874.1 enoyl-CoA hydratase/isomerase family protein [Burkholderia lata]
MRYARVEKSGAVSTVVLDRPERLNAISGDLLDDLHQALVEVNADEGCKVIVFTGEGRAFCAGDDLKEFGKQTESDASIRSHVERIQQITRDLMFNGKPVIGAVHGFAVGGGFEWLLNCDLVVASDDLVCFFPEMAWGQFVTGGVTQLLPQSVGHQRAMELWLLGERQSAQQLYALGLVNRVVERDKVLETARELATRVSERSAFSVSRLKRLLTTELSTDLGRSLELEQAATVAAFATPEAARRVQAFATRK